MKRWSNWSGRLGSDDAELVFVRSEEDARALVAAAAAGGRTVRAAGAGHSHAPLVPSDGVIVDTSGLSGVIEVDSPARRAWVWAGSRICTLGRSLHDAGLALANQGDIDRQAIAGAVATGTHGTGRELKNLSAAVTAARVVLASGELVTVSPAEHAELWPAVRLNLGAVGLVTRLQLQLREPYVLAERGWSAPFEELAGQITELVASHRHFEFFWYPGNDTATAKAIVETDEAPVYPLAEEGRRRAFSYEVLPNHRPHPHTEMEYSVPAGHGPAAMRAIRELLRTRFTDVRWPVEYRTVAADDVWLSTAYQRDVVTISVHQDVRLDERAYYRACEEIFLEFGGRPHWGKVHGLDGAALAAAHPRWRDWWACRDAADPGGVFLNDYLRSIRP